jgi:hypothetical protein
MQPATELAIADHRFLFFRKEDRAIDVVRFTAKFLLFAVLKRHPHAPLPLKNGGEECISESRPVKQGP